MMSFSVHGTWRRGALVAFVGLTAGACAYEEADFRAEAPAALCAYYQSCDPPFYSDDAACTQEIEGDFPSAEDSCTWDEDAARSCLDALERLTCEGSASNVPTVCSTVWDCSAE